MNREVSFIERKMIARNADALKDSMQFREAIDYLRAVEQEYGVDLTMAKLLVLHARLSMHLCISTIIPLLGIHPAIAGLTTLVLSEPLNRGIIGHWIKIFQLKLEKKYLRRTVVNR